MALSVIRRTGLTGFVVRMTLASIIASLVLSAIALGISGAFSDSSFWQVALAVAVIVPAIVAPIVTTMLGRLINRLDAMGETLRVTAITDPLTGVVNRRGFFELVAALGDHDSRPLRSVAMVDLDNLKQLNDTRGHAFGDRALGQVADWLVAIVGESGHVARFGGDEFVALGGVNLAKALPAEAEFIVDGVRCTASTGTALWACDEGIDLALARADAALYRHKVGRIK